MKDWHDNIIFILVRPQFLGNIGATARVLKNFGFERLRLVDPPRNYKDSEARRMSVGAFDVLKRCEVFASLSEALHDVSLAFGTTSGQSRDEKLMPVVPAADSAREASAHDAVAFVFGDERDGLTRSELLRCHRSVTVPVNPAFPALNVSQAVGIVAYELTRERIVSEHAKAKAHTTGSFDDHFFTQLDLLLDTIEFTRKYNRHVILQELRSLYQRMRPTEREADILSGVVRRLNQKLSRPDGP